MKIQSITNFNHFIIIFQALYQGCPNLNDGKTCNKKVQDQGDGTYRCEKCGTSAASFNWRYNFFFFFCEENLLKKKIPSNLSKQFLLFSRLITKMAVADATDNQWVNCFQEQGEALLGTR